MKQGEVIDELGKTGQRATASIGEFCSVTRRHFRLSKPNNWSYSKAAAAPDMKFTAGCATCGAVVQQRPTAVDRPR